MEKGVFITQKKDGSLSYRTAISYKKQKISLGSFDREIDAALCFKEAKSILNSNTDFSQLIKANYQCLPFSKAISLLNLRDNLIYIKAPIYLYPAYFEYYISPDDVYIFDTDDLFYFSTHPIHKRGGHLYVNDFGMQYNILNRYGIKNYAIEGKDYDFANGHNHDFRYSNIKIKSQYSGVLPVTKKGRERFKAHILIGSDRVIGYYRTEQRAAIAYNKAVDYAKAHGVIKDFAQNYIADLNAKEYADLYTKIKLPVRFTESFEN